MTRSHSTKTRARLSMLTAAITVSALLTTSLALTAQAYASRSRAAEWREDPYTSHDPQLIEKLGYVSYGPFAWDSRYGTDHIRRTLGSTRLLFVETTHFKIGCELTTRLVPGETRDRRLITAELRQLKEKLPRVVPRTRKLDPWLLLHLYAQRLEGLYSRFSGLLKVADSDFPSLDGRWTPGRYMGKGPFLGQKGKFCVILFDRRTQLDRYLRAFPKIQESPARPRRHRLPGAGSLAFATASECFSGQLFADLHMHSHVIGEVAKNLIEGYKSKLGELPPWCLEGLAHWLRREVTRRINLIDEDADPREANHDDWNWARRVGARVSHDYFPTTDVLFGETSSAKWTLQTHMMAWSRVDFLMRRNAAGMRRFLDRLKDRPIPFSRVSKRRAKSWQETALQSGWDLDAATFDAAWMRFVMTTYPH